MVSETQCHISSGLMGWYDRSSEKKVYTFMYVLSEQKDEIQLAV